LLFITDPTEPIDFKQSVDRLIGKSAFVVNAVTDRRVTQGDTLVGIPAYNESETIAEVVEKALAVVDSVLVIDDGSSDETATAARTAGAEVVSHSQNKGYGAALKSIFAYADRWDVSELVVIDGDGQHDASDISKLLTFRREHGHDVVIGSRFVENTNGQVPLLRRLGIHTVSVLTNVVLRSSRSRVSVSDAQSGLRAYDRAAIELLTSSNRVGDGMASSTDILFVCASKGLSIGEVGIEVDYDVTDPNTHHPVSHGMALIRNIIRIIETEYPIRLLGIPGLVLLLIGGGFGYWTTINYLSTATFPIGLAITATLFSLAGVLTLFTSIILHALNLHSLPSAR
jgi:glycosyltransferase involved in cell wall biosynthesis